MFTDYVWCCILCIVQIQPLAADFDDLPCDLPFAAHDRRCNQRGLGLSGLIHKEAHPVVPDIAQSRLKSVDAGCLHRTLVQHINNLLVLSNREFETVLDNRQGNRRVLCCAELGFSRPEGPVSRQQRASRKVTFVLVHFYG